jgi:DNA polymerase III delta subunit
VDARSLILSGDLDSFGKTAPGYLIVGEEIYWHRKIIDKLTQLFPNGRENLSGDEASWETLRDNLSQPSFFGPSLWVVRAAQSLLGLNDEGGPHRISDGNCLVLSCTTKDNPAGKGFLEAWYEMGCVTVTAAAPSFGEAVRWVESELKAEGLRIPGDAAEMLVTIAGRSMDRLEQEVAKIVLYMDGDLGPKAGSLRPVTSQVVLACVSQDPEKTAFGFIDAVAQKNLAKATAEITEMRSRGANAVMVVALLASHFALMWRAKEADQKGTTQASLPKVLGVHPYAARKALMQSRAWSFRDLENAFKLLLSMDESIKKGMADPDRAIDYLLASLCKGQ